MFKFTYGYELELGDVSKNTKIPPHLGSWENAETDILNIKGEYYGTAADPLGICPPVGGEINVMPSNSIDGLVSNIESIFNVFKEKGEQPTASCVNHGHVHIRVKGLRNDVKGLMNIVKGIKFYQNQIVPKVYGFYNDPLMSKTKTARRYLKQDGGRLMPNWLCDNLINHTKDFEDFIRIHCCGKDAKSRGRPFRYAFNTYCMKHTDTIEFRFFRGTTSIQEIKDSVRFCSDFLRICLEGNFKKELPLKLSDYKFPKFNYNHQHYLAWENTKYPTSRGKKQRRLYEI